MAEPSLSDSKQRPRHLSAVAPSAEAGTVPNRSRLVVALGLALGVALLGWLLASQNGAALKTSLEASNAALAQARAELTAYDTHVTTAHDRAAVLVEELTALTGRLGDLRSHLADRPVADRPAAPSEAAPEE